jgi:hypothetical protein
MTYKLFGKYLSFGIRNGVGFDLEFCTSRPMWVTSMDFEGLKAFSFNGTVILLPFLNISYGECYDEQ